VKNIVKCFQVYSEKIALNTPSTAPDAPPIIAVRNFTIGIVFFSRNYKGNILKSFIE